MKKLSIKLKVNWISNLTTGQPLELFPAAFGLGKLDTALKWEMKYFFYRANLQN